MQARQSIASQILSLSSWNIPIKIMIPYVDLNLRDGAQERMKNIDMSIHKKSEQFSTMLANIGYTHLILPWHYDDLYWSYTNDHIIPMSYSYTADSCIRHVQDWFYTQWSIL